VGGGRDHQRAGGRARPRPHALSHRTARLFLGLLSAALVVAILVVLLRGRQGPAPLDFREVGELGVDPAIDEAALPPAPDAQLPGVLELERPLYPPSTFQRRELTEAEIRALFPVGNPNLVRDPDSLFRHAGDLELEFPWKEHPAGRWTLRTNSLGLRMDEEVRAQPPDLRVLVVGDSHTDGVCDNADTWPALVQARLAERWPERSAELLNAARAAYTFHNYLGTLERLAYLRPDVLVVAFYSGNDFDEALSLHHLFNGSERPPGRHAYRPQLEKALEACGPCLAQAFLSIKYFAVNPREQEVALQAARDVCTEILVTCLRQGIRPVFVHIPSMAETEWAAHAEVLDAIRAAIEVRDEDLGINGRLADSLIDFLRQRDVEVVDLRPAFRAAGEPLFWNEDSHLNLAGQRVAAEEILPVLAPLLDPASARAGARTRRAQGAVFDARPEAGRALLSPGAAGTRVLER